MYLLSYSRAIKDTNLRRLPTLEDSLILPKDIYLSTEGLSRTCFQTIVLNVMGLQTKKDEAYAFSIVYFWRIKTFFVCIPDAFGETVN